MPPIVQDALIKFNRALEYWKTIPATAQSLTFPEAQEALKHVLEHHQEVKTADTALQLALTKLKEAMAVKAQASRKQGALLAKQKTTALAPFTSQGMESPPAIREWLWNTNQFGIFEEVNPEEFLNMPQHKPQLPVPAPPKTPMHIVCGKGEGIGERLGELKAAVGGKRLRQSIFEQRPGINSMPFQHSQLRTKGAGVDSIEKFAEWIPDAWLASHFIPEMVRDFGSCWLLTQQSARTRTRSGAMPLNGSSQLLQALQGDGWVSCWHSDEASLHGEELQGQHATLMGEKSAWTWVRDRCFSCKITEGDLVWVPFGWFTAVTSSTAGPLVMLAMPFFSAKLVQRHGPSAVEVLQDIQRVLEQQSTKDIRSPAQWPWNKNTGLEAYMSWCADGLYSLENPIEAEEAKLPLEDGRASEQLAETAAATAAEVTAAAAAAPTAPAAPEAPRQEVETVNSGTPQLAEAVQPEEGLESAKEDEDTEGEETAEFRAAAALDLKEKEEAEQKEKDAGEKDVEKKDDEPSEVN